MIKLANKIYSELIKRDIESVMWGDGILVDIGYEIGVKLKKPHPLNMMTRLCAVMRTAPHLFEHRYIRGIDSLGRDRLVNGYKVIK
jgi:hypothetical protein